MTTENLRRLEDKLTERGKKVKFILISIDPAHETQSSLLEFAKKHKIDRPGWSLLAGTEEQARAASGSVGLGFGDAPANRELHQMHSLQFAIVDGNGKVLGTFKSLDPDLEAAKKLLK